MVTRADTVFGRRFNWKTILYQLGVHNNIAIKADPFHFDCKQVREKYTDKSSQIVVFRAFVQNPCEWIYTKFTHSYSSIIDVI